MSGGCGVTVTLGIDMVVASAPPNKAGAAAGISETSTGFGGALGVAILGSIWTVLYRARISPAIPAGLPAADAENMRNTLAGAISAAYRFNSTIQQPVILAARNAFVHSFNITCGICAALVFITAFITALKLRQA
jgi:DHA2 family multidrug resistance protein-like MFS transporter